MGSELRRQIQERYERKRKEYARNYNRTHAVQHNAYNAAYRIRKKEELKRLKAEIAEAVKRTKDKES
jgi:hypothetical protein